MANIIVMSGGQSEEREVSLRSGEAVAKALKKAGHDVNMLDPVRRLETYLPALKLADMVFIALHGALGEDGVVQEFLERHDVPFVGSGSESSRLCFDKIAYANLMAENGIDVPASELVDYEQFTNSTLIRKPFVLKPNEGGSSIDTFIVRDVTQSDASRLEESFSRHNGRMLLQPLVSGIEITASVLNNLALPVIEIIPPKDQEFDYENKYNGATQELCPPIHIDKDIQHQARSLAERINDICGCRDLSRTDMIFTKSRNLVVLETNTIPGLTDESLFPKAARAAGHDMVNLCQSLVTAAAAR